MKTNARSLTNVDDSCSTIIGADATIKGDLTFEKGARVLGRIEGTIESKGDLVLGEEATLDGDAQAKSILLEGKVVGNVKAVSSIKFTASARLEGDMETAKLEVEEGAVIVGRCSIGADRLEKSQKKETVENKSKPAATTVHRADVEPVRTR